jgi:predicted MPP superfamily phosphohydrolase
MMPLSRRRFLETAGLGAATVTAGGVVRVVDRDTRDVEVTRHVLSVPGLPAAFDGELLAQISDVHLPFNQAAAERTLELIRDLRPAFVALTGDLLEQREALPQAVEFARAATARARASWLVLGNWEYVAGVTAQDAERAFTPIGVEVLANRTATIRMGGGALAIAGLDDPFGSGPDPRATLAGVPYDAPTIWLLHEPGYVDGVPGRPGAAAVLAGHTHGGQIRIPLVPAVTPTGSGRFVAGWYRDTPVPLYVSRGVGTTTIRARFRCRAELPVFTLRGG